MQTQKEKFPKRSSLLRGAFCAVLLAFTACGGDNSTSTDSTDMGCASGQAKPSENYTSSSLMAQILESLNGNSKIDPLGLFSDDTPTVQQNIEKYGIDISSQTKSSMNFKLGGKDYSFKVLGAKDALKVSLSSGNISCELDYPKSFVDQCPQESSTVPTEMKSSQTEFESCIQGLAPASNEGSGSQKPYYDGEFN